MKIDDKNIFSVDRYYKYAAHTDASETTIGLSTHGLPINILKKGEGDIKLLVIARLHGNEPATTQALLEFFKEYTDRSVELHGIYLSNPDGASKYEKYWREKPEPHWTNSFVDARLNGNGKDLNRDWLDLKEKETRVLQKYLLSLQPDFVLDLHEFYWSDKGYPPKYPTDDDDGFLATMTDCPYYLVNEKVERAAFEMMNLLTEKLEKDFDWKIKLRHFIGENNSKTYQNPDFLGIYLALRGFPKLLIETWGVACSTLLLDERIDFHKKSIKYAIQYLSQNENIFKEIHRESHEIRFEWDNIMQDRKERFLDLLKKHRFRYKIEDDFIYINCKNVEVGFLKTIYILTTQQKTSQKKVI